MVNCTGFSTLYNSAPIIVRSLQNLARTLQESASVRVSFENRTMQALWARRTWWVKTEREFSLTLSLSLCFKLSRQVSNRADCKEITQWAILGRSQVAGVAFWSGRIREYNILILTHWISTVSYKDKIITFPLFNTCYPKNLSRNLARFWSLRFGQGQCILKVRKYYVKFVEIL